MRRVDDRGRHQRAKDTTIGDGKGAALHFVDAELTVTRTLAKVDNRLLDVGNFHVVSVTQNRHHETTIRRYGNTDVLVTMVNDIGAIDGGVDIRETLESFGGGFHEEAHETKLGVVGLQEGIFVLGTQRHHRTHVHFVVRGQHGSGLLCLNQALGDGLTQTAHRYALLGTLTLDRWRSSGFGGCRGLGRFLGRTILDGFLNVFFQNATAFAGTFDLGNVQIVLGNHLASSRCQHFATHLLIGAFIVSVAGSAAGRRSAGLVTATALYEGCQNRFGLNLAAFFCLDFRQGTIGRRYDFQHDLVGFDVGQHFVTLDRFAYFLVPGRHGAFLNGLGEARCLHVVLLASGWLGGFFGLGLLGAVIAGGTLFLAASTARFADLAQYLLGLDGIAFFGHHVGQGSRFRCDDFKYHFIGLDFNDQLVAFDAVTRLFVPRGHGAFGNGFRKGWRFDLSSHVVSLMCSLNPVGAYRLKASSTSWRCCSVWTDM